MWLKKLIFLLITCTLVSCSSNGIPIIDDSPVDGKPLSFPSAFYQNIVYIDGQLIGFTLGNQIDPVDRVSFAFEGEPILHPFNPQNVVECEKFIGYSVKGILPDGRIGFLGCGEAENSNWSIFAIDWTTGETGQLVKGALTKGYSSKDFTWNPEMTLGVQEMVDGAQGTIYWISQEGISPMDVEIEDQGLRWNLKDYYEHRENFEPGIGFVFSPAWSPDGNTIAFFASTYGMQELPQLKANIKYELYFMNPTELKPVQVLKGIANASRIRWSPDSKYLLFQGCVETKKKCGLWIYSLGSNTVSLVTEGEFFQNYIWSKNSSIVAIKYEIDNYLKESEIWEYSITSLLR